MLFVVRRVISIAIGIFLLGAAAPYARKAGQSSVQAPGPAPSILLQASSPSHGPSGPVIVLDPAHGGTDTGARGAGNIVEKDVVLGFAKATKTELEQQGFRVVLTRDGDDNPSYDDRTAKANSHRDVIFVSFHVSSTGPIGTARAYSYQFASPLATIATASSTVGAPGEATLSSATTLPGGWVLWDEAQRPYREASHRLADTVQGELAQRFPGSPVTSSVAAVRSLRSVAAPALAIEVSSVSVSDPATLAAMASPLATAISRGLVAYGATDSASTK